MSWPDTMSAIASIVQSATGLTFPESRRTFSAAAIRRAMRNAGFTQDHLYVEALATRTRLVRDLIDELTVGETYFFRDPEQFGYVRSTILAQWAAHASPDDTLRLWCAGCSSGEEAYTMAIIVNEAGLAHKTEILATDVSHRAIDRARQGRYSRGSFRTESLDWREHWLTPVEDGWQVRDVLRRGVAFDVQNLTDFARNHAVPQYDLIMCRNVLMYLDERAVSRILDAFARSLAPGGWLLTSPADPVPARDIGLEPVLTNAGILYQRQSAAEPPVPAPPPRVSIPARRVPARAPGSSLPQSNRQSNRPAEGDDRMNPQIHVTLALTLLDLHFPDAAIAAARRAIFLDSSLAVAHFTLGRALRLSGKALHARRALQRAQALLSEMRQDDAVNCAETLTVGALSAHTVAELSLL